MLHTPQSTLPLAQFVEEAYLDYAMYVIMDRALPYLGDGLKPVQRRIIYAMSELGLKPQSPYKKSARTVGDVLGKFHPHGDSACYEAMVLMAQSFSYRYPLIDGQGNWGAPDDPKSFAAMRYTGSKLTAYSDILLSELKQGAVEWIPNFDGSLQEPRQLPARLPNLLLNGSMGIAVGMATAIPPHNLCEVVQACIHLLKHPNTSLESICKHLPAPDFPSRAEIISPQEDILELYRQGVGSLRIRATYQQVGSDIVITTLPPQVSSSKVLEQIAQQIHSKHLNTITDLRDESDDQEPIRLVLTLKSQRVKTPLLMSHLFATTDLERSYRFNLNVIGLNHKPEQKNLLTLLTEWLEFRRTCVAQRCRFRLKQLTHRLHILQGLKIVYLNLDTVISIIREHEHPAQALMQQFELSQQQVEAILNIKLRQLGKLEALAITQEQQSLTQEQDELNTLLSSEQAMKNKMIQEFREDARRYGDRRQSLLVTRDKACTLPATRAKPEAITIVLSQQHWIRRIKGHDIDPQQLPYKSGDQFLLSTQGQSDQPIVLLDSTGRSYTLDAQQLAASPRNQGEPLTKSLTMPDGAYIVGLLMAPPEQQLLLSTTDGYGFITTLSDITTRNRSGKIIISTDTTRTQVRPPMIIPNTQDHLAALSSDAYLLIFPLDELPSLKKGRGHKIIARPHPETTLQHTCALSINQSHLKLHTPRTTHTLKGKNLLNYLKKRAQRGLALPKSWSSNITVLTTVASPTNCQNFV